MGQKIRYVDWWKIPVPYNKRLHPVGSNLLVLGGQRVDYAFDSRQILSIDMNPPNGISDCIILERVYNRIVKVNVEVVMIRVFQYQVERCDRRSGVQLCQVPESVAPKTPKLWGTRSYLEPVMADE